LNPASRSRQRSGHLTPRTPNGDASINLTLSDDHSDLRFEVADTGVGFDQQLQENSSGLTHIRDRIGAVHGHVSISSTPNHGTSISATIPLY
jgi:signal transduction histidine kinase